MLSKRKVRGDDGVESSKLFIKATALVLINNG